jgi:hypothetical protein
MSDTKDSEFLFPSFAHVALLENADGKNDSKVSGLWTKQYESLLSLQEEYIDLFQEDSAEGGPGPVFEEDFFISPMNPRLTSHHAKKGANVLMSNSSASGLPQIFRTGWEVRTCHSIFDYLMGTVKMMLKSGKTISGWNMTLGEYIYGGYPAILKNITQEREKVGDFVFMLFGKQEHLPWPVQTLAAAALLKAYDKIVATISKDPSQKYTDLNNHPFIAQVQSVLTKIHVTEATFKSWKEDITNGFITRNRAALAVNYEGVHEDRLGVLMDPRCFIAAFNTLAGCLEATQCKLFGILCAPQHAALYLKCSLP